MMVTVQYIKHQESKGEIMARTFTLPKKGTGLWNEGWHTLTITKAERGELDNGSKYIDTWFDGYPDNFNMRTYEKIGKNVPKKEYVRNLQRRSWYEIKYADAVYAVGEFEPQQMRTLPDG